MSEQTSPKLLADVIERACIRHNINMWRLKGEPSPDLVVSVAPMSSGWVIVCNRQDHTGFPVECSIAVTRGDGTLTVESLETAVVELKKFAPYMWLDYADFCVHMMRYKAHDWSGEFPDVRAAAVAHLNRLRELYGTRESHSSADLRAAYEARQKGDRV